MALLLDRNLPFCIRCDIADNGLKVVRQFMQSGQGDAIVTLPKPSLHDAADYACPRTAPRVHLIRQVTPQSKVRVLMTSLFDAERFPVAAFA